MRMQPRSEYAASIVHSRHSLSGGGRTTWDAAAVSREGLAAIAPFVDRHAQAFRDLAHRLRRDYLSACEMIRGAASEDRTSLTLPRFPARVGSSQVGPTKPVRGGKAWMHLVRAAPVGRIAPRRHLVEQFLRALPQAEKIGALKCEPDHTGAGERVIYSFKL